MLDCDYNLYYHQGNDIWSGIEEIIKISNNFINPNKDDYLSILNTDYLIKDLNSINDIKKSFEIEYKKFKENETLYPNKYNKDTLGTDILVNFKFDKTIHDYFYENIEDLKRKNYEKEVIIECEKKLKSGMDELRLNFACTFNFGSLPNIISIANVVSRQAPLFFESVIFREKFLEVAKKSKCLCLDVYHLNHIDGGECNEMIWERDEPKSIGKFFEDDEEIQHYLKDKYEL